MEMTQSFSFRTVISSTCMTLMLYRRTKVQNNIINHMDVSMMIEEGADIKYLLYSTSALTPVHEFNLFSGSSSSLLRVPRPNHNKY